MNARPARAAAAAISSGELRPSDRLVWMWMTPRIAPSRQLVSSAIGRGGRAKNVKTTTAATRAAAVTITRFTVRKVLQLCRGLQRRSLVGPLPGELGFGPAEVP